MVVTDERRAEEGQEIARPIVLRRSDAIRAGHATPRPPDLVHRPTEVLA